MEGIRDFEKNIFSDMDFVNKYIGIKEKFIDSNSDDILKCDNKTFIGLIDPKYHIKHKGGGYYTIKKAYSNFELILQIHKTSGAGLLFYIYIKQGGVLQDIGFNQYGAVLRYLPYDTARIEKTNRTFGYNNLNEMKDYLNQMIGLWEEFTDLYIEKLKLGIEPPNTPYEDD